MKKKVYFTVGVIGCTLALLMCFFAINNKNKNTHYITTFNLEDSLYAEKFELLNFRNKPSGQYLEYITDSTNFRKYIGMYNDYSFFKYQKNGDLLIVKAVNRQDTLNVYETKSFQLSDLKKEGLFE